MKLEEFILKNQGKSPTGYAEFQYEDMLIHVRPWEHCYAKVSARVPCLGLFFETSLDITALDTKDGELVGFYNWLQDVFMPSMKEGVLKKTKRLFEESEE